MPSRAKADPYTVPMDGPGSSRTAEWRWPSGKPVWTMAEKEGVGWLPEGRLTEEGRMAILKHFGLEEREFEFPLEAIVLTCPRDLERESRKGSFGQSDTEHVSDRIGAHIPASLVM